MEFPRIKPCSGDSYLDGELTVYFGYLKFIFVVATFIIYKAAQSSLNSLTEGTHALLS